MVNELDLFMYWKLVQTDLGTNVFNYYSINVMITALSL